jgi:hypothetical protein
VISMSLRLVHAAGAARTLTIAAVVFGLISGGFRAPSVAWADDDDQQPPPAQPAPYQGQPGPDQDPQPYQAPPGGQPPYRGQPPGAPPPAPYQPPTTYQPPYPGPQPYPPSYGYARPAFSPAPEGPAQIADVDDAAPVPNGYTRVTRTRKGPIIGGAVALGVGYGISAFAAAIGDDLRKTDPSSADISALWIPVAGPFLVLGQTDSSIAKFYLLHLGLAQGLGAALLVYGLSSPRTFLVRNDRLSITPMMVRGGSGLALGGAF